MILDKVKNLTAEIFPKIVDIRRKIHQNPELAFEEYMTSGLVKEQLNEWGIPYKDEIAKTGVIGSINGENDGITIALRADMDALPINEQCEVEYKSLQNGKMHACGHDAHTASLLGTAYILSQLKEHINGTVNLIFQPSEERLPGGASVMIKENALENVNTIVGQHVMPLIETGKVGIRSGQYMASADEIYIKIKGKGGHAAQPHTTIDPIAIASQLVVALQQVVSRRSDPRIPSVLSFGKFIANGATNVIPEIVTLEGTFRTFDETWRSAAHQLIENVSIQTVKSFGASIEIDIRKGYPVLYNDVTLSKHVKQSMISYLGKENVEELDLWMASEDFSYYTHHIPGCFYRLGTRNEKKKTYFGLHHPQFNIDEDAFSISTGLMAWLAIQQLQ